MTEPHPLVILAKEVGVKPVADLLAEAFARVLETPEGEAKFVAYLHRKAAERRAARAPRRRELIALTRLRRARPPYRPGYRGFRAP